MRNPKRETLLVKSPSSEEKIIINPANLKEYMVSALRSDGIGLITNYGTTWRDLQLNLKVIKSFKQLPSVLRTDLLKAGENARKALAERGSEMTEFELKSCKVIASMPDKKSINSLPEKELRLKIWHMCEAALKVLRLLQETAINTAKSGVWVNFDDYKYVQMKARASWHKGEKHKYAYESKSLMGFIDKEMRSKWEALTEWATKTSSPLQLKNTELLSQYKNEYKRIQQLRKDYAAEIMPYRYTDEMSDEEKDEISLIRQDIALKYHNLLRDIAMEVGNIDDMSALVYLSMSEGSGDGSFAWDVWTEELIHTLKHQGSGSKTEKLVPIKLYKEYETFIFTDGSYMVVNGHVASTKQLDFLLGTSKLEDGVYQMKNFDGRPYFLIEVEKPTIEKLKASLEGVSFQVLGFKYNSINREIAKQILIDGKMIVKTIIEEVTYASGKVAPATMVYAIKKGANEWVRIGNIAKHGKSDSDSRFHAETLVGRILVVSFPKKGDSLDTGKDVLTVTVDTVRR